MSHQANHHRLSSLVEKWAPLSPLGEGDLVDEQWVGDLRSLPRAPEWFPESVRLLFRKVKPPSDRMLDRVLEAARAERGDDGHPGLPPRFTFGTKMGNASSPGGKLLKLLGLDRIARENRKIFGEVKCSLGVRWELDRDGNLMDRPSRVEKGERTGFPLNSRLPAVSFGSAWPTHDDQWDGFPGGRGLSVRLLLHESPVKVLAFSTHDRIGSRPTSSPLSSEELLDRIAGSTVVFGGTIGWETVELQFEARGADGSRAELVLDDVHSFISQAQDDIEELDPDQGGEEDTELSGVEAGRIKALKKNLVTIGRYRVGLDSIVVYERGERDGINYRWDGREWDPE